MNVIQYDAHSELNFCKVCYISVLESVNYMYLYTCFNFNVFNSFTIKMESTSLGCMLSNCS